MEENNEKNLLHRIIKEYGGAVIGGLVALVLCFTEIYRLLVYGVIILAGVIIGNYIQKNKPKVKEKLKEYIDKF